eukprot:SAG11_NODE_18725_length_483_cov_0.541667_2_plen_71_part_01
MELLRRALQRQRASRLPQRIGLQCSELLLLLESNAATMLTRGWWHNTRGAGGRAAVEHGWVVHACGTLSLG